MDITEQNISRALDLLIEQIKIGDCILFLGAGVHAPPPQNSQFTYSDANRPLVGKELAHKLAEESGYRKEFPDETYLDLQRVSLNIEMTQGLGRRYLVDLLDKYLRKGKKPSPALNILAELPFKIIVTTNYDSLLETALYSNGKDPQILIYNPDFTQITQDFDGEPTPERPFIFKIHGDLNHRESLVITDEDYINFIQRMSQKDLLNPIPSTISYRMQRWYILFIGYGFADYNLRLLFRTLRFNKDRAKLPETFSLDTDPDPLIIKVYQYVKQYITFVMEDLWIFLPWLYRKVKGKEFHNENLNDFFTGITISRHRTVQL